MTYPRLPYLLLALTLSTGCGPGEPLAPSDPTPTDPAADAGSPPAPSPGTPTPPPPTRAECDARAPAFDALVKSFTDQLAAKSTPGGAIAVVCGGTRVFSAGVGTTARSGGAPVTATTRFQMASITKTFTATLAVRLAQEGLVDLDASPGKHVPFVNVQAPYDRSFTWKELLSHSAGYPTYFDDGASDLEENFRRNGKQSLWAPPGAVWDYSNEGFGLAGLALQRATGEAFGAMVEKRVFAPAGMSGARMDGSKVLSEGNFASGHSGSAVIGPTDSYLATTYYGPMGGAWASADDLARFAKVVLAGGAPILDPKSFATMTTARISTGWPGQSYALGLFVEQYEGGVVGLSHGGSVQGFLAELFMVPSAGFAVVTLVNSDEDLPNLRAPAFEAMTGGKLVPAGGEGPRSTDVDEQLGIYASAKLGNVRVERDGAGVLTAVFESSGKSSRLDATGTRDVYTFDAPDGYPDVATFWRVSGAVRYFVSGSGIGQRK